jgi:uncharacterized OB-fold protein
VAAETPAGAVPAVPYLEIDASGRPRLKGSRCAACGATMPGLRTACCACGARGGMQAVELGERGRLYSYTIVHRSFPGVKTPFVAAIVELEGGATLKGTLVDVAADPAALAFDMPLRVVYRDTGQKTAAGAPFISYFFTPAGARA